MADKSIGAIWTAGEDKKFSFSGSIDLPDGTKLKIVVFENDYKEGIANRPDFKIYKARDGRTPSGQETLDKMNLGADEVSDIEPF